MPVCLNRETKMIIRNNKTTLFFFFIFFTVITGTVFGQNTDKSATAEKQKKTVNIIDIPKEANQAIMDAREIRDRLVKVEDLMLLRKETDSLVKEYDLQLRDMKQKEMPTWSIRKIEANLIKLQQDQSILQSKRNELQSILDNLVENKKILSENLSNWKEVRAIIRKNKSGKTVEKSVNDVLSVLNKTIFSINNLTALTMGMTRKLSALELDIDSRISMLGKLKQKKNREILQARQPSLFSLDYKDPKKWNLSGLLSRFYNQNLKTLADYLSDHLNAVIIHLLLLIALVIFFLRLKKIEIPMNDAYGVRYKRRLKALLARPVSTALVLGMYASVMIYPNRPLILRDITIIFILPPLTLLLKSVIKDKFQLYVYVLAIVMTAIIAYSYIPAENIWSRFLLLFIGLTETVALVHLVIRYKKETRKNKYGWLLSALIYLTLFFSLAGLFSSIVGKVMLAEYVLFSIAEIIFVLFLVLASLVIINGISVVFITSRIAEKSRYIQRYKKDLIKKTTRFFNFIAIVILLDYVLSILKWKTSVLDTLSDWLGHEYNIGTIVFSWGRFVVFIFIIWLSIVIARFIRDVLEDDILNKVKMDEGLPHTIAMMVRYALISIGILLAFGALGIPVNDLAIIFSAFGVGIGFGLQNIFNNLVSGFILLFERPIKIGDTIEVGDMVGTVRSIGIRASNIRTFDGAEIIVPNGNLISSEVVNWTLSDQRRRIEIKVNVGYQEDPKRVKEILLNLLEKHDDVAKDPKPGIFFIEMGKSALVFRILFWTHQYGKWYSIRSNMMYDVFQTLKEAGIEIPYDQLDLHIRSSDTEGSHPKANKTPAERPD
jgi:potassium efflux system protein